jgi:hypothetical protein
MVSFAVITRAVKLPPVSTTNCRLGHALSSLCLVFEQTKDDSSTAQPALPNHLRQTSERDGPGSYPEQA